MIYTVEIIFLKGREKGKEVKEKGGKERRERERKEDREEGRRLK